METYGCEVVYFEFRFALLTSSVSKRLQHVALKRLFTTNVDQVSQQVRHVTVTIYRYHNIKVHVRAESATSKKQCFEFEKRYNQICDF